jgi:nucleoside phosphorylase
VPAMLDTVDSERWSLTEARRAAAAIRAAALGRQAAATLRPRVVGVVRSRAPLPLLLYVAARDGLVVTQDGGGFAVLRRPAVHGPDRSGGYGLRLLRCLDRNWEFVVLTVPAASGLLVAGFAALIPAARIVGLVAALAVLVWVAACLTGSLIVVQLGWVARLGAPSTSGRGRAAEWLPGYHWSVPLVHQPDPERVDELLRLLTDRLVALVQADVRAAVAGTARVDRPQVTETLVVITTGVSTAAARGAIAESLLAIPDYPGAGDVIVLASPGRLERVPRRPVTGGGFLLIYALGLAVALAVCASFVAETEAAACRPSACAGRPATYALALRWLLQRMLFTDPPGLSPGTARSVVLGWLISLASGMLVLVAVVAARQELARNRRTVQEHDETLNAIVDTGRVLILVVSAVERDAVLDAVRLQVGRRAVTDTSGERTVHRLGTVAGTELMLAQAGEQGTATAAGMLISADRVIKQCRPDFVMLAGICYGLRPDEGQRIGDIVVARRVQGLDQRRATDALARPTIYRGVNVGVSPLLLDRFQAAQTTWSGARVHIGTVLSGNLLVDSEKVIALLRTDFPDAIAGEMEGAGVHEASTLDTRPDWIMVKGISDWGYHKSDRDQRRAAANAADYLVHVVLGGGFRAEEFR